MRPIDIPLASLALIGLAHASAAAAGPTVRQACMPEIRQLCAVELAARNRDRVKSCLMSNKDRLSENCRAAIAERQDAKKE
ncbi:hypothetical protein [Sphingomonas hylomeconis]|uniref:Cysteine rich repeat-containing protein n=1 Tax=Sphingomonas hylomeconis TaxID=1395958 RepID=A0ABV7SYI0_9SPHN|nr:hypothetical protein [Sphingomonas hylomeconis]